MSTEPTNLQSLADRMYGTQEPAAPAATAATAAAPPETEKAETSKRPPATEEEPDIAERMYGGDVGAMDSAEEYHSKLGSVFDGLEHAARFDRNEDNVQALAEGRRESAALLHEMRVTKDDAREISFELGHWNQKYLAGVELSDEAAATQKEWTESTLKAEWGDQYEAKIAHARSAAEAAMDRLPWLRDLLERGAGNSESLVRHFAKIGERNAKREGAKR